MTNKLEFNISNSDELVFDGGETSAMVPPSPYIGENGHWYIYDNATAQYVDSGVDAQGPQGPQGPAGADGVDGRDGQDAPQIDDTQPSQTNPWSGYKTNGDILTLEQNVGEISNAIESITYSEFVKTLFDGNPEGNRESTGLFTYQAGYVDNNGDYHSGSNHNCWYCQVSENMYISFAGYAPASSPNNALKLFIFDGDKYGSQYLVAAYNAANNPISEDDPVLVQRGQYITLSIYNRSATSNMIWDVYRHDEHNSLKPTLPLTELMREETNAIVNSSISDSLRDDALPYVSRIPSYWNDEPVNPVSFEDGQYLEQKISSIPNGKSFFFLTDVHYAANEKHSIDIIQYLRKRTGIRKVLFGGDIVGYANNKYDWRISAGKFMYAAKRAFGKDFIACVGDHDYNGMNPAMQEGDEGDFFPTYAVMKDLFVGDLRYVYSPYEPEEKLSEFCTPGTDDFNECMNFFRTIYTLDDTQERIRYIALNCGASFKYGAVYDVLESSGTNVLRLQYDFLSDSLMSTPDGYDIVVLSHKAGYNSSGISSYVGSIISNFMMRTNNYKTGATSGNETQEAWWNHATRYDYGNRPNVGKVFCIEGHDHSDHINWWGVNSNGDFVKKAAYDGEMELDQDGKGQIPFIVTRTDAASTSAENPMEPGTITEQAIDIVTIMDDRVHITRVGYGENRDIFFKQGGEEE